MSANGSLPYRRVFPSDRLAAQAIRRWPPEAAWAHEYLLDVAWVDGGIPVDRHVRAGLLGFTPEQEADVWAVIGDQWEINADGRLTNDELEAERQEGEKRVEASRRAGRASGRARRGVK